MEALMDMLLDLAVVLLTLGLVGLTTSWALLHRFKPRMVVLTGALTMGCLTAALFFLPQIGSHPEGGFQPSQFFDQKQFEDDWKTNMDSMSKMGVDVEKFASFKELYQKYVYDSLPAWEAIRCLLWGLLAYYVASSLLSRITNRVAKAIPFREWIVPEPLIFGLIVGGSVKIFAKVNGPIDILADNLLVFFVGLYTLGGFSIVSFFLYKWRFPRMLRFLGYVIIFWFTFFSVCCLGILDVWFDFRKIKSTREIPS